MHHPVNCCSSGHGVGEDLLPLREDQVGCDAEGPVFVALGDEGKEHLRLLGALRQVSQVIQQQEVVSIAPATVLEPASGLRLGPWRITFDTNPDDCNLHCIMCEDHSPYSSTQPDRLSAGLPKRRMDIDLIRRVLADSVGTPLGEIIPSAMGEPLLYRDFDEILDLCAQYGVKLNLTTNGTFPRRGARGWAERIVPVTSDVKVSWNATVDEAYYSAEKHRLPDGSRVPIPGSGGVGGLRRQV